MKRADLVAALDDAALALEPTNAALSCEIDRVTAELIVALTPKESREIAEELVKQEPANHKVLTQMIQEFVDERGMSAEDIKELMYDLPRMGVHLAVDLPKALWPKPAKKAAPGVGEEPPEGEEVTFKAFLDDDYDPKKDFIEVGPAEISAFSRGKGGSTDTFLEQPPQGKGSLSFWISYQHKALKEGRGRVIKVSPVKQGGKGSLFQEVFFKYD